MSRLSAETLRQLDVLPDTREAMYILYADYYGGTDREMFIADLGEKDYVVLLRDERGCLRGFSTLAVLDTRFEAEPVRALFSGDTIIHHDYWGGQALPMSWCRLAGEIKSQAPHIPLYWFLIVKGHRTYRYLNVFSKRFYPTWRYPTPGRMHRLMDTLAGLRFGKAYRRDQGIVHFPVTRGHLKPQWADIGEHQADKPDVRYFLQRNPHFAQGDELVCLTELSQRNLRRHAREAFMQGLTICAPG